MVQGIARLGALALWCCVATPLLLSCGGGGGGDGGTPTPTNSAPHISGPTSFSLLEGSRLSASVNITDVEGDPIEVRLTGADAHFFSHINIDGGSTHVLQIYYPLDFENPEDANHDNAYEFDVTAGDGHSTTTAHFVVRVNDVPGSAFSEEQGMTAILGIEEFGSAGNAVGFAGDLDGDGRSEVLIGNWTRRGTGGAVFAFPGASLMQSKSGSIRLLEQSEGRNVELNWPTTAGNANPQFGREALGVPDLDGDHLGEIAVTGLWNGNIVVDIIRGSAVASALEHADTTPKVDVGSTPALRIQGGNLARLPDLDGDGLEEMLICAGVDPSAPFNPNRIANLYVIFGSTLRAAVAAGGELVPSAIANGGAARMGFMNAYERGCGDVASAGDFDGDGKPDVVIGESRGGGPGIGQAHVVFGRAILQARQDDREIALENLERDGKGITLIGEFPLDDFGRAVAGIGDFNKDGLDDVAIGADWWPGDTATSGNMTFKGAVFVLYGSRTPFPASLPAADLNTGIIGFIIRGTRENDEIGGKLASAGDINSDGFADFYIASMGASEDAHGLNPDFHDVGRIDLVLGTNAILSGEVPLDSHLGRLKIIPSPVTRYTEDFQAYGDVDGDGQNDLLVGAPGSVRCTADGFGGLGPLTSTGGAFFLSRSKIAAATNGMLDLGDHLFGKAIPSVYQGGVGGAGVVCIR